MRAACVAVAVFITAMSAFAVPVRESASHGFSSSSVLGIVTDAVEAQLVPGVCLMAGTAAVRNTSSPARRIVFNASVGRFTYDSTASRVNDATLYDLASLTKVTLCTTATALLFQQGYVDLDLQIADPSLLGPSFAAHGKGSITIRHLLTHSAGFPPDPSPGYLFPSFGCPNAQDFFPRQTFECMDHVLTSLCENQTLSHSPGSKFVYSDLSMITLMFVVGKLVKNNALVNPAASEGDPSCTSSDLLTCFYLGFVRSSILNAFGLSNASGYLPRNTISVPPQWNDEELRHRWINGFVSDENAFAMGGVSGHAGFFANINDLSRIVNAWAWPSDRTGWLNQTTVALFTTVVNRSLSSRALGWDTHTVSCGSMTRYSTFTHTGFTGTQVCVDPVRGVFSIVLANAKYANKGSHAMVHLRPRINSAIVGGFSGADSGEPSVSVGLTVICVLVAVAIVASVAVYYGVATKCQRRSQRRVDDDGLVGDADVISSADC